MTLTTILKNMNACNGAVEWSKGKTIKQAWKTCHRGDWMLWFYARRHPDKLRELTLAKAYCANTVRHLMNDERSKIAIDVAIKFGEFKATKDELKDAANAAAAATAAADTVATYAAASAAAASAAICADAYVAASVADYAATATGAYKTNNMETANICRKYLKL